MNTLEKSKYVKESGDGAAYNCHQLYLKAATVRDGEKAPNINMVMSKDLKTLKTVFFNNEGTVKNPFMLAPHVAEHILGRIVDLLTQKLYSSISWTGAGLEVSAEVQMAIS